LQPGTNLGVLTAPIDLSPTGDAVRGERHSLTIDVNHVVVRAAEPLGVGRGLTTLLQLAAAIPSPISGRSPGRGGRILDEPRYASRGLSLDLGRRFLTMFEVRRSGVGQPGLQMPFSTNRATLSAPTKFRTDRVTRGRRHLIPDPARSSAKSPTSSGDSRVLVVDVGRDDCADPQYEAIESAVEQPGDANHGGDREHEGVVTEQFRDEEDRDER
jgi:hypothetical protein